MGYIGFGSFDDYHLLGVSENGKQHNPSVVESQCFERSVFNVFDTQLVTILNRPGGEKANK